MNSENVGVSSGVAELDRFLGGLFIGDNVVWHDDAGSLASVFCQNFIRISQEQNKPLIYVSFDRSPKNLINKLGPLARNPNLTILDCFTYGKGDGSDVFLQFYDKPASERPCRIVQVTDPRKTSQVMEALYGVHSKLEGDVRFFFESLTGMQDLWGGEEDILHFYTHSCPRLYELSTIAYWIIEKRAHTPRLRAQINQIAQVVIDLSVRRGKTSLTILKAEKRNLDTLNKPHYYWNKDLNITFDSETHTTSRIDLGVRLKALRTRKGLSQTEVAKRIGVTPSTISQIESNLIFPSLPALFKIADILSVEPGDFFEQSTADEREVVFPESRAVEVRFPDLPKGSVTGRLLIPFNGDRHIETYLIEIPPATRLPAHFFIHKGHEFGYLLSGELQLKMEKATHEVYAGDAISLTTEIPLQWKNPGSVPARLLWLKLK